MTIIFTTNVTEKVVYFRNYIFKRNIAQNKQKYVFYEIANYS